MEHPHDALPTFGRSGHLTHHQQQALDIVRAKLKEEGLFDEKRHDDHTLLRFLRARKFDVEKTMIMLKNYETWRKEFAVDELVSFYLPDERIHEIYPRFYHNTDKLGRPVYIERLGNLDLKKLMEITDEISLVKFFAAEYERVFRDKFPACSKAVNAHIEQCCTILDLKGVALSSFPKVMSFVKRTSSIAQDYYPETMGRMFIINAPMLFTGLWSMVRPWLDEVTVKKITILGSSYQSKLLEVIDAEALPEFLGGHCKCPGKGCAFESPGPWKRQSSPAKTVVDAEQ